MSKIAKNIADHNEGGLNNEIQDPPEYNAKNDQQAPAAHPASHAGRMGTGNIASVATQTGTQATGDEYTKHRFNETPSEATMRYNPRYSVENAKNPKEGSDWLGGPQNGNESPSTSTEGAYQSTAHSTGYTDQLGSADWLGGPQNGNEIPGNGGNGGNGGNSYGSGNSGNGGNGGNASESLKKP